MSILRIWLYSLVAERLLPWLRKGWMLVVVPLLVFAAVYGTSAWLNWRDDVALRDALDLAGATHMTLALNEEPPISVTGEDMARVRTLLEGSIPVESAKQTGFSTVNWQLTLSDGKDDKEYKLVGYDWLYFRVSRSRWLRLDADDGLSAALRSLWDEKH
jgi:hypothetical protein